MLRLGVWALGAAILASPTVLPAQETPERPPEAAPQAPPGQQKAPGDDQAAKLGSGDELEEGVAGPTPGAPTVSLEAAIARALQGNFGILGQADSLTSARFNEQASRAQFHPQVTPRYQSSPDERTLTVDALQRLPWTGGSISASGSFHATDREDAFFPRTSDLRLTLTQPLLQGFGPTTARFDLVNSRRARIAQERSFQLARQRLVVDVTTAYYQVIRQRQLLLVARESSKRSASLRKASEARMAVGLASKLDVLRADLQVSQADEAAVAAKTGLQTALEQFRFLLGLAPDDPLEPEAVELPRQLPEEVPPVASLVQKALANRLELREAEDAVDDARRAASVAGQRLLPQLDLNVGITRTGYGASFSDTFHGMDKRLDIFVTTSYPVERSAARAAKAVADLQVSARQRALRQQELQIEGEVRAAARDLERIRQSVALQQKGVEFAAQQHRLATLRYQRGLASNFDVVDAEGSLVSARTALVGLLTEYQVARVRLLRATGELNVDSPLQP